MEAKIRFGIDYLYIMWSANIKSGENFNGKAYRLSRMMLCWEWGLTSKEEDEANKLLNEMVDKKSLEDFSIVVNRVVDHLKNNEETKRRFITDMMMVNLMDGNVSEKEKDFTLSFANDFDFRNSEIVQMAEKASDLVMVLGWYVENWEK